MMPRDKECNITSNEKLKSLEKSKSPVSLSSAFALGIAVEQSKNRTGPGLANKGQCPICCPC